MTTNDIGVYVLRNKASDENSHDYYNYEYRVNIAGNVDTILSNNHHESNNSQIDKFGNSRVFTDVNQAYTHAANVLYSARVCGSIPRGSFITTITINHVFPNNDNNNNTNNNTHVVLSSKDTVST